MIVKLSTSGAQSTASSASSGSGAAQPFSARRSPDVNGPDADALRGLSSTVRAPDSPLAVWTTRTLSEHLMSAMLDASCLADPKFTGSHELTSVNGPYAGQAATLVVYANPQNPATVLSVVYASPCSGNNFRILDEGLVAKPATATTP